MIYIKNNQPIKVVKNFSPYKTYIHKLFNISHFQILSFIVYVFLYKEKQIFKLEKYRLKAFKKILISYNS